MCKIYDSLRQSDMWERKSGHTGRCPVRRTSTWIPIQGKLRAKTFSESRLWLRPRYCAPKAKGNINLMSEDLLLSTCGLYQEHATYQEVFKTYYIQYSVNNDEGLRLLTSCIILPWEVLLKVKAHGWAMDSDPDEESSDCRNEAKGQCGTHQKPQLQELRDKP